MSPGSKRTAGLLTLALALAGSGCSVLDYFHDSPSGSEPRSQYGNPPSYVALGVRYHVLDSAEGYVERGLASWYGPNFHGRKTSSGEIFDMHQISAAHKSLPLPTWVKVTHLETGRSITVRVNDRGPFKKGRIIDLSYQAALTLGITGEGLAPVEVRAIHGPSATPRNSEHRFLQLGAFSVRGNAESFVQKLRRQGLTGLSVRTRQRTSLPLHRVLQGPFDNNTEFNQAISKLEALGITEYTTITIPHWKPINKK